jgi:chemotaxis protein MotB
VSNPHRRRKHGDGHKPNHERWMISYADLLTLLLAVFIVLYAESANNTSRLHAMAASMMDAFSGTPPSIVSLPSSPKGPMHNLPKPINIPVQAPPTPTTPKTPHNNQRMQASPPTTRPSQMQRLSQQDQMDLQPSILAIQKLKVKLSKMLAPEITQHTINILSHPLSIKIRLNAKILFRNGQASLTKRAISILKPLGKTLGKIPPGYVISIRGYTDNVPIHTAQFPSNWQLSTSRALSVLLLFRSVKVSGESLSVEGFSKYHAISSNKTKAGRALNRRISIVITAPKPKFDHRGVTHHDLQQKTQISPPAGHHDAGGSGHVGAVAPTQQPARPDKVSAISTGGTISPKRGKLPAVMVHQAPASASPGQS